ncbi:MAG: 4-hydroxy-tetrahydrodipicolinate reductase [Alphaproteobacteria bacterium]|nr:4-hydroxy-tetrahydrodipicolinate reductase [Alphaproteobacteria bacterium]MBF0128419.1 4-hydroxy-tetrahydrodipicolinate reductase [Alphaproteobacteria bacterium]
MRIGIFGCSGRMGRMLVAAVLETPGSVLAGGVERPGSEAVGQDLGSLAHHAPVGRTVGDDPRALFEASDVVIDFSSPAVTADNAALAVETGKGLVVGTTGLGPEHLSSLSAAAKHVPVVQAPNMSLGITLLLDLVEQMARLLNERCDIEILEMHHRHKVDAPSGTALALGRAAALGRGVDLDEVARRVRDGITGPRGMGDIGFATLRGGNVVGEHTVIFADDDERIEITHKATSRLIFARGALHAALWTEGRPPGLYSMRDVLGLTR